MKLKAFRAAFPLTLPICAGFLFIGISYGLLMSSMGFSFIYPMLMSLLIFAGSMEFVTVNLLIQAFDPMQTLMITLMVNARHLFYGVSMLEKFKDVGIKKWYLIFGMCDESFSINCVVTPPEDVDKGWFMFFVTLLNQVYWVVGATLGGVIGTFITFDLAGIEFVMTALFVVMFLNQWEEEKNHSYALIGVSCAIISLILFGRDSFMIPAMIGIVLCFYAKQNKVNEEGIEECQQQTKL